MENILDYENLIYSIIKKYTAYFDPDDLYQVGMLGLIQANDKFDSNFDVKFSSYAYYYIKGEVLKYIRENKTIKVSKDILKLNSSIEKTKDVMRQRLGREPTTTEISLFLEIDEEKINEASLLVQDVKSLDYTYDEESSDFYNSIQTQETGMQEDILDLKTEVMKLQPEERALILARYYEELTQTEASYELGMSQVQVSRKEGKILEKLKQRL